MKIAKNALAANKHERFSSDFGLPTFEASATAKLDTWLYFFKSFEMRVSFIVEIYFYQLYNRLVKKKSNFEQFLKI